MCVVTLFYETRPIPGSPAFPSSLALPSRRLIRCAADAQIIGQCNRMTQLRSSCVIRRKGGKGEGEQRTAFEEGLRARSCATLARERAIVDDRVLVDPNRAIDIDAQLRDSILNRDVMDATGAISRE